MPPGTGDVQLSIAQNVPVSGAVLVSTPQDIALSDVRRGAEMFHKVKIPVFGMIENMSHFTCPNCGSESRIFGSGRIEKLTEELKLEIIGGKQALNISIVKILCNRSLPIVTRRLRAKSSQHIHIQSAASKNVTFLFRNKLICCISVSAQ